MTRLTTSVFLSLLLLLILLHQKQSSSPLMAAAAAPHPNIIIETCKQSAEDDPNVNYTFCVAALQSVPRSRRADLRGLAVISLKLAKANATHAKAKAKALLKEEKQKQRSAYRRACLETCRYLYADAASSLKDSAKMIKSGRYGDARVYISSVVDAPGDCDDSFREGGIDSPLAEENRDLFQLAVIALAITSRLG